MVSVWEQINQGAADVVTKVQQSLVQIVSDMGSIGAGSVWRSDGLILTNAHVVVGPQAQANLRVVLADGRSFPATILAADSKRDLALLQIDAQELPTIMRGSSSTLQPGQYVMALGHPWGVLDALTGGVVIGTGYNLPEQADGREWIALDLKMRPGHSGGPLFNVQGELVGINTMIRGPQVSFAIPADLATAFVNETLSAKPEAAPPQAAAMPLGSDSITIV